MQNDLSDDHEATIEAQDLRKLMIEIAKRMTTLARVYKVSITFNINRKDDDSDYRLTAFTATKTLDVE